MPISVDTYKVQLPLEFIRRGLSNMEQFKNYHPLIFECLPIPGFDNKYMIKERPFTRLPIVINYDAVVSVDVDSVKYTASRIPLHNAEITYLLKEKDESSCDVEVTINVKGPPLLSHYLTYKMVKAQAATLLNMKASVARM